MIPFSRMILVNSDITAFISISLLIS